MCLCCSLAVHVDTQINTSSLAETQNVSCARHAKGDGCADLACVKNQCCMPEVHALMETLISRLEADCEKEVNRVVLSHCIEACECEVEAMKELMPLKNFIQVGAKLAQYKVEIKQLTNEVCNLRMKLENAHQQLQQGLAIGSRSLDRADTILSLMRTTNANRRKLMAPLHGKVLPLAKDRAQVAGLTPRQFNRLLHRLETFLYALGVGNICRTKLLLVTFLERPAISALLGSSVPLTKKMRCTTSMIASARNLLRSLKTRGSMSISHRKWHEVIATALMPDDALEKKMLSHVQELLGLDRRVVRKVYRRKASICMGAITFSAAVEASTMRQKRKDFNLEGRKICRIFWHQHTRFDTNSRKKKRRRIGPNSYVEHWRHIQYDTNESMWNSFQSSHEYGAYLLLGGTPISRSFFFSQKCWCIVNADHEECACPLCTQMFELVRDWDRQRSLWYRDADNRKIDNPTANGECTCGDCMPDSAYRASSKSVHALNEFLLCPKQSFPSLTIREGCHACADVKLRRRQCCRAPILPSHMDHKMAKEYMDCSECGMDRRMPHCPIEHTNEPATYKVYSPRGESNQEALIVVNGTRSEFMAQLRKVYQQWLPHYWIKTWCEHQRHLTYSTFKIDEACISTDFSAVYDHKAWATRCCEQPHHSNMAVFVLTYRAPEEGHAPGEGMHKTYTEVLRVISEAKGNTHFHNIALQDVVTYLKSTIPSLRQVYLFTDGCKGQYKGRKNFARIAEFPSILDGIKLVHRFSASHHFKGPHDQYGKDAKALTRVAEKFKKRRLPTTYDWYHFLATEMAQPLKKARTVQQVVNEMTATTEAIDAALKEEAFRTALAARRVPVRVKLHVGANTIHVQLHIPRLKQAFALAETQKGLAKRRKRLQRSTRKRKIIELGDGHEVSGEVSQVRIETSDDAVNGIFSATRYHWAFYGLPGAGLKDGVPFGQICQPTECHKLLDVALEGDADTVANSDSMYEFAGINPNGLEGELHTKCFPCHCEVCREMPISIEFIGCPNQMQTGMWRRQACHRSYGIVQRAEKVRKSIRSFALKITANDLLAAAADPNWTSLGGRKYWLLRARSKAFTLRKSRPSAERGVSCIKKGTVVVKAQWYEVTDQMSRKYKLQPEVVLVPVHCIIQELGLDFARGGSESGDSLFPDNMHARIMSHNLDNYR